MAIKLSELNKDTMILVCHASNCDGQVMPASEFISDYEKEYKNLNKLEIYTTEPHQAAFNAEYILDSAIESEADEMYEDWDEKIKADITKQDIDELQAILDRILARNEAANISYFSGALVEIDI